MSGASFIWFVFSPGGILLSVLSGTLWLQARPRSTAARRVLIAIVVAYTIISIRPVPRAVTALLGRPFHPLTRADVPPGPSAVVLLGSGSETEESWTGDTLSLPDPMGAARTLEAFRVSRLIDAEWVISSGGGVGPDQPAGLTMRDVLVQLGVPAARVIVEQRSLTTHDQAVIVASMLPPLHVDHVILVTSQVHMRRSLGAFRAVGIEAIPAVANEGDGHRGWQVRLLPTGDGLVEAAVVAHELLGLPYYVLRGWMK